MSPDAAPTTPVALTPSATPRSRRWTTVALASALVGGMAGAAARDLTAARRSRVDACGLPAGVDLAALSAADRSWIARRAVACQDLHAGRISRDAYRDTIATLDRRPTPPPDPPPVQWAARVVGVSSQWSPDSWSALRVLGPPDVYPASGDHVNAWASRDADAPTEWIEVALDRPTRLAGVDVYETYNPGAISQLELVTVDGRRQVIERTAGVPLTASRIHAASFACTAEPIASIRVTLDSGRVAGWNELDAIGARPCE